jgi:hypothetical protein
MAAALMQLRADYDVIIIDTPPLAAGADALALGTLAGNVVLVVRTGSTDRELTDTKLEMLERLPLRILGAILNDVPRGGTYHYYGYESYLPGYESTDEEGLEPVEVRDSETPSLTGKVEPRSDNPGAPSPEVLHEEKHRAAGAEPPQPTLREETTKPAGAMRVESRQVTPRNGPNLQAQNAERPVAHDPGFEESRQDLQADPQQELHREYQRRNQLRQWK